MKKIRRIPTLIGLFLLVVGLVAGTILIRQGPTWLLRAGPELTPQQVKITNVSDNSFTASWTTDAETSGFVKYGTTSDLTLTVVDDRDQLSGETDSFFTHHVTLKNLEPSTDYFFKIGSGGQLFDNNGQPYQVKTGPAIQSPAPANDVAYGTIVSQDNAPASGVIVYLALANTTPLSTLTKSSGSWVIPLNLARSTDLASYAVYDRDASIEEIFVQGGQLGTATAVTTTRNDSPVPTIILGQSFDFRQTITTTETEAEPTETPSEETSTGTASAEPTPTLAGSRFSFQEVTSSPTQVELSITNPTQGETLNTQKPEFLGAGPAGKVLIITVQSPSTYSGTIVVNAQGDWEWTPPADLEPGEHTVTISYTDEDDQDHTVSKTFTILAAGESGLPSFTATPSGEATPSPTPTITPTATPTTPPSTRAAMPSTDEGVPTSGILAPTFLVFLIGLALTSLGIGIRFLKI